MTIIHGLFSCRHNAPPSQYRVGTIKKDMIVLLENYLSPPFTQDGVWGKEPRIDRMAEVLYAVATQRSQGMRQFRRLPMPAYATSNQEPSTNVQL